MSSLLAAVDACVASGRCRFAAFNASRDERHSYGYGEADADGDAPEPWARALSAYYDDLWFSYNTEGALSVTVRLTLSGVACADFSASDEAVLRAAVAALAAAGPHRLVCCVDTMLVRLPSFVVACGAPA